MYIVNANLFHIFTDLPKIQCICNDVEMSMLYPVYRETLILSMSWDMIGLFYKKTFTFLVAQIL